jgi:hypothetical protein
VRSTPTLPGSVLLRLIIASVLTPYLHLRYRIRRYGPRPPRRRATLILSNHQHDLEGMVLMTDLFWARPLVPVYAVSSRRLFEPGFMAQRFPYPWLYPLLNRIDWAPLFERIGVLPLENQPLAPPYTSLAYSLLRRHGNLPLEEVFSEEALRHLGLRAGRLKDLWSPEVVSRAAQPASILALRSPYREEIAQTRREEIEGELAALEEVLRQGGSLYLTPEGRYSKDGSLGRLKASLERLLPLAEEVWLAGIAYDVFASSRLTMVYRWVLLGPGPLREQLLAARPVLASQLVAAAFEEGSSPQALMDRSLKLLRELPKGLFVDPELERHPERSIGKVMAWLKRQEWWVLRDGRLYLTGKRRLASFPEVEDPLAYQRRFFEETLKAQAGSTVRP